MSVRPNASPATSWVSQVHQTLTSLADPERAVAMSAYMRGQFPFFGIPTLMRRKALGALIGVPQSARDRKSVV
jgi:hypothetical protein